MDALLKETVDAAINSRYPGMAPEGRRLIEEILIRKEVKLSLRLSSYRVSPLFQIFGDRIIVQSPCW